MLARDFFLQVTEDWPFANILTLDVEPWEWLKRLPDALDNFFQHCPSEERLQVEVPPNLCIRGDVFIGKNVELPPYGFIQGPAYIGEGSVLRPSVYVRGNVIVGPHCVLGNSCEFKQAILLDHVQAPHFNYVGDSALGSYAHLGAGVILSNVRFDKKNVRVHGPHGQVYETGLRKLGAILGDYAEMGCNAVAQPGTCLFPHCKVYPVNSVHGTHERDEAQ